MTYWPYIVNWILPSPSSSSSEYHEDDDDETNQSPIIGVIESGDQSRDIDSVVSPSSSSKRRRTEENDDGSTRVVSQKRLWTKEDELELLHGFSDYTSKRRKTTENNNSNTNVRISKDQVSSFFETRVASDLKTRFSKNQIVDKLRRLKKKYRNISAKGEPSLTGFQFKTSHEKVTFDMCREIWKIDDETTGRLCEEKKTTGRIKTRSALSNNRLKSNSEESDTVGLVMELGLSGYVVELMRFGDECDRDYADEDWKDEKILELESYLKRLEIVQSKVKASLDKLRADKLD